MNANPEQANPTSSAARAAGADAQAQGDRKTISFSPPDIGEAEVEAVAQVLRSGWITTGPRTKELEGKLAAYTGAAKLACLNSATAALECALRLCGIGPGDEVIVPAYTYTASASVVVHVGATPVLVDVAPGSFFPDAAAYAAALTPRTKAIIPVDLAGIMADYDAIFGMLEGYADWQPANDVQECFTRPIVIADAAHALGASQHGIRAGRRADFTAFSFHAVKNFTTAEGGALAWRPISIGNDELYGRAMRLSLHGQTKDALHKESGRWEYDIEFPGYKWNMTDIQAALGLVQFERYPQLLERREQIVRRYQDNLAGSAVHLIDHFGNDASSSYHLAVTRVDGANERSRNDIIGFMSSGGIACNVHYKPLPMLSTYRNLGLDIADFPNAFAQYENEVTLPLHTLLTDGDVDRICSTILRAVGDCL